MRRRVTLGTTLGVGAALSAIAGYEKVVRPWQEQWGATDDEVAMALPGDAFVLEPASQVTRAITIDAPPADVWPWIVQLGADRGGFYSYDRLENLFGLGIHSANRIVPEWQTRRVDDLVYANLAGTGGWYVVEIRPGDALVLQLANLVTHRPARRDEGLRWEFLWTFALRPTDDGATRLLVRERVAFDRAATRWLLAPMGLASFVMTHRMLVGIRARAEAAARRGHAQDRAA
jgi:hypothetical protein